jgi:hypothetical protein
MKPFAPRGLLSAATLGLLAIACGPDASQVPFEPQGFWASHLAFDDPPRFSDWSEPINLGPIVNSEFADFNPFVSKDGLSLYFAAGPGRPGEGLRDIWVSERTSVNEAWGVPRNLGPPVNTGAHEVAPVVGHDGAGCS